MHPEDNRDVVTELANRVLAKMRRGEEWGFEFEIEFASLTDEERDDYIALVNARTAHGEEKVEALQEDNRLLKILLRFDVGLITPLEAVHQIRGAVPDPLAGQKAD